MVHESASAGYQRQSSVYASVRPSYHPDLVDRFVEMFGNGAVVELGAGSGIFTSQLVASGCVPTAVEPVSEMRERLHRAVPQVVVVDGSAEATGLEVSSVDTVVAAQAFHWFDHPRALDEIDRILRSGGHLVCLWNVRDENVPWVANYTEIVDRYAGDTPRYRTMEWRRAIDDDERFEPVGEWELENPVSATPDQVVDRALSTSFIAALDESTQRTALEAIRAVTDDLGPTFDYPYRSELQAWVRA